MPSNMHVIGVCVFLYFVNLVNMLKCVQYPGRNEVNDVLLIRANCTVHTFDIIQIEVIHIYIHNCPLGYNI